MTGLGINSTVLYAFGNIYSSTTEYSVHKYNTATGGSSGQYMNQLDFPGLQPAVYDIAYSSEGVWVARDEADSPVLRYNTSGVVTGFIAGSTIPEAAGLAVDPDGFLWVSDPGNDKIYKVDTFTSVSDTDLLCPAGGTLYPAANPFYSIAAVNAAGYADGSSVQVFDMNGRRIHTGTVSDGSYSWNTASDPAGAYLVQVSDAEKTQVIRMVKIQN